MMRAGLGVGVDMTVPAQIFAPHTGEIDRAARFIPAFARCWSSWLPGMTLTPLCFQSVWLWS